MVDFNPLQYLFYIDSFHNIASYIAMLLYHFAIISLVFTLSLNFNLRLHFVLVLFNLPESSLANSIK